MLRLDVTGGGEGRPRTSRCSARSAARTSTRVRPYALYLRIRPWTTRDFDIQVGRVPPTFGAFARRTYANDNPLIGYPLAYQYLTSLRPDAVPANADELLRMRGRGWLSNYSLGDPTPTTACRWSARSAGTPACRCTPAGMRRRHGVGDHRHAVESAGLGRQRRPADRRPRRAASGRRPDRRRLGRARAVRRDARGARRGRRRPRRRLHADGLGRRRRVLARLLPAARRDDRQPLDAADRSRPSARCRRRSRHVDVGRRPLQDSARTSTSPRASIIWASATIAGPAATLPWDAPVTRFEIGGGYSLQRNLLLKAVVSAQRPRRRPRAADRAPGRRAAGVLVLMATCKDARDHGTDGRVGAFARRVSCRLVSWSPSVPRRRQRGAAAAPSAAASSCAASRRAIERRPGVADLGHAGRRATCPICCDRSSISKPRRAARSSRAKPATR